LLLKKELSKRVNYRVPILIYHYVEFVKEKNDTIRQSLAIIPLIFEGQIKTLKDAGYTFLTAAELAEIMEGNIDMPHKPVVVTIDDGHWDIATDILPILIKHKVKATAYLISGFVGQPDFLSREQLQEVVDSGLIEIGAHTVHHIPLRGESLALVQREVVDSKTELEAMIGKEVISFAYPHGSFDAAAQKIVEEAGFKTAVTTNQGVTTGFSNRYMLYRLRPGGRTGDTLLSYLETVHDIADPQAQTAQK
jgi:peptidoglycan/xylan/chitin deacetylase (PgdA/CDA1 family)